MQIHDAQAAEKWKRFKLAWTNYSLAKALDEKYEAVQVATLLTVIGEEARDVFRMDERGPVLAKFEQYCKPQKHVPFERYRFNPGRMQEAGGDL